ncbi:family 92 glycoside hydrolase, partial [Melampsora larici-populina 98AG31]
VPFGMVKISVDCQGYAPAGYVADAKAQVFGLSPLHDSGIGSAPGSYGNFEIMPMRCPQGLDTCNTTVEERMKYRAAGSDEAAPGYFSSTLKDPMIKLEATSTRRAGLERFTFEPDSGQKAYFVLDLAHDISLTFEGGQMEIDPKKGRIKLGGRWGPSFGSGGVYQAFSCYDVTQNGETPLDEFGVNYTTKIQPGQTKLDMPSANGEAGAVFSYPAGINIINIRVGTSFVSADQACRNAEEEIGERSFDQIREQSVKMWNERLEILEIPLEDTEEDIAVMIYSSMYRSFLTPNNATGETQGLFENTTSPYFDSLYCSWDTSRTFFPWMNLHSPRESAQLVEGYIDGWRKTGVIPECRSNNLPGYSQGGAHGLNIMADFALKYHKQAADLGVDLHEMYTAMISDAENTPDNWDFGGRQVNVWKKFGYIPYGYDDPTSTGHVTREVSRTLEYSWNDFAVNQVARLLGNLTDAAKYETRALWYRNVWNPDIESDGYKGFFQRRDENGEFYYTDPKACSPKDPVKGRSCYFDWTDSTGFYESSPWEYSLYAPHDTAHLIELHGGKEIFAKRLDHFFDAGYYSAGNEPSFQAPGAMATFLLFHLLGLFPVPSTTQYLVLSPWVSRYTLHNRYLNVATTVRVTGFDKRSLVYPIPKGVSAYVKDVRFNGNGTLSRCFIDFHKVFTVGGDLEIILTADQKEAQSCNGHLPDSLSTGGFKGDS